MSEFLITGATGFLGRHLSAQVEQSGGSVIKTTSSAEREDKKNNLIYLDTTKPELFSKSIVDYLPDTIVHLAALSAPSDSENNPMAVAINYGGVVNLLNGVMEARKIKPLFNPKVIFYSSFEVYGDGTPGQTINESTPHNPVNEYGRIKDRAEKYFIDFCLEKQINGIAIQHGQAIGVGQSDKFLIPSIVKQINEIKEDKAPKQDLGNGKTGYVLTTGKVNQERNVIDVRDASKIVLELGRLGKPGEQYIVCGNSSLPLKTIVDTLIRLSGMNITHIEKESIKPAGANRSYDNSKATQTSGIKPTIPLDDTLRWILEG